jgi:hypothetical protein
LVRGVAGPFSEQAREVVRRGDDERIALGYERNPLHLQRKFEQRWAARFAWPVASAAPNDTDLKDCHAAQKQSKNPMN